MTTDQAAKPRTKYTDAEREAITQQVVTLLASGMSHSQVATQLNIPSGTVKVYSAAARAVQSIVTRNYSDIIIADVRRHAEHAWRTLDVQLELLGDKEYIEAHGGEVFALASAYRIVAETLGRFLAATSPRPRDD